MKIYQQRRQRLLDYLAQQAEPAVAVIASAALVTRSHDTEYPFRQNSNFYYLTGFNEPNALLILAPHLDQPVQLLCQPSDPAAEVWHGRRLGVEAAKQELGVDMAASIEHQNSYLKDALSGIHTVFSLHQDNHCQGLLKTVSEQLRAEQRKQRLVPTQFQDLHSYFAAARLIKDEHELALMRTAAAISVAAHKRAMTVAQPGRYEYQVAATLEYEFALAGALHPAYGTICGSGENACILHYTENTKQLQDGELLLIDAGAEYQGYAADITRTFPVNGRFTGEQRALYEVVLAAQHAALAEAKVGSDLIQAYNAAARVITEGLIDLKILHGSLVEHLERQSYRRFFIHGLGHWLGLDVHDDCTYQEQGEQIKFAPNMVLTVEPGIYIPASMTDVNERWHNIGIRIEDDIVITPSGHENLTADVPKTVEEIEQWIQNSRK